MKNLNIPAPTIEQLQARLAEKFKGHLASGGHKYKDGECCLLELKCDIVQCGDELSDSPVELGMPDFRSINDAFSSNEARTRACLPLLVAYWDWKSWTVERKISVLEHSILRIVREVVAPDVEKVPLKGFAEVGADLKKAASLDSLDSLASLRASLDSLASLASLASLRASLASLASLDSLASLRASLDSLASLASLRASLDSLRASLASLDSLDSLDSLASLRASLASLRASLDSLASLASLASLRASLDSLDSLASLASLRASLDSLRASLASLRASLASLDSLDSLDSLASLRDERLEKVCQILADEARA